MMTYRPKDHFFHKAKKEGFVARSAFKLQDLQKKYKLIRPGDRVLDLGCAPGSWSQVAIDLVGSQGEVIGVDLSPVKISSPHARFIQGNILELNLDLIGEDDQFDVILSDMAPKTTGIRITDQARSEELCRKALLLAKSFLREGGHLVMKIFEGPDAQDIVKEMKASFQRVERIKPEGVRKGSFETYLLGLLRKKEVF